MSPPSRPTPWTPAWPPASADPPTAPDDKSWTDMVADAAALPIGVYELPQLISTTAATVTALDNARRMAVVLLVRGLRAQADGDSKFVDRLINAPKLRQGITTKGIGRGGVGIKANGDPIVSDRPIEYFDASEPTAGLQVGLGEHLIGFREDRLSRFQSLGRLGNALRVDF